MIRTVSLACLLMACLAWAGCSGGSGYTPPPQGSSRPGPGPGGRPGPRPTSGSSPVLFNLPMTDGQQVSVRGPAALFFFTTWCGYCKQAMPEINRLAQAGTARGWRVYGIDVNEDAMKVNGFIQQYNPSFPVLMDQDGSVMRQYGVRGYPTFVVIDANGNVIYNGHDVPRNF